METITGTIYKVFYESQDNDFKVFSVKKKDRSIIRVTGEFPQIMLGANIELHGEFKTHPKYGPAFKANAHTFSYEKNAESICLYIQSIAKWVGPQRSLAIAEKFGSEIESIIENTPERLMEIEGIGEKIALSISEAWKLNTNLKDIQIFLHGLGLSAIKIRRVITMFGSETEKILTDNPWRLCEYGFGFTTCDHIASKLGKDMGGGPRYKQFILYTFRTLSSSGHLFLYPEQLVTAFNNYNSKADHPFKGGDINFLEIAPYIKELIQEAELILDKNRLYGLNSFFFENESARLLVKVMDTPSPCKLSLSQAQPFLDRYEKQNTVDPLKPFKLSDMQADAIKSFFTEKVMIITGPPGSGKCLGKDTPILMYDGSIKMVQDVVVGDLLMGDDSTPREVLSLARGKDELYRVTPTKGDSYVVNSEHILSLKESPCDTGHFIKGRVRDISIKEYLNLSNWAKHHLKGYRVPVEFKDQDVPIDPYILGFWLGNGAKDSTRISTIFPEVLDYISTLIKPLGLSIKKVKGDNVDYGISSDRDSEYYDGLTDKRHPNIILDSLRALNLINNKHIPDIYKYNSREKRLRLLAGIIDSDGYSDKRMGVDVLLTNKVLAYDVQYVVRSLGFSAYLKECTKKYNTTKKGHFYSGEVKAYRFNISGDALIEAPIIAKKRKVLRRKQKKDVLVTGIKVDSVGYGDYYGFEITGNRRFLLGDFTVTHNTTVLKAFVQIMKENGISFELMAPTGIAAKKLANTAGHDAYTIHRRLGYKGDQWDCNNSNKYATDAVIVDEGSMVDQEVFYRLISALYSRTKIVFVGDNDQLPSVGPGCVLKELIDSNIFKTIFLNKIFRQEKTSEIILEAKKIRDGDTDLTYFRSDKDADIWHISDKDEKRIENLIIRFAQQLKAKAKEKSQEKNKITFQIITPRNEGPLSVYSLNAALQEALNPHIPETLELKLEDCVIRKGDRILIKKNNYEYEVFNGDVGKVVMITPYSVLIDIDDLFGSSKRVDLPTKIAEEMLKLAYCLTVHKCLPKGTLIHTSSGVLPIEDIKRGDQVLTHKNRYKKVIWSDATGKKPTISFITQTQSSFKGSPTHGFLVSKNSYPMFVQANDIKVGDFVCVSREVIKGIDIPIEFEGNNSVMGRNPITLPTYINEDMCWLIGALIGDGCYTDKKDGTVEFAGPSKTELLDEATIIFESYGLIVNSHDRNNKKYSIYVVSKNFREFLLSIGLGYTKARDKSIPDIFFKLGVKERAALLSGLFDTDGSVSKKGSIRFRTSSPTLAVNVKMLLHSLGIISFFKQEKPHSYLISIFGVDTIRLRGFIKLRHPDKYKILNDYQISYNSKTNHYEIPYGKDIIKEFMGSFKEKEGDSRGVKGKGFYSKYPIECKKCWLILRGKNKCRLPLIIRLKEIADIENIPIPDILKDCLNDNYYFDRIVKISVDKALVDMYEIEVEEDHSYSSPSFICHNCQGSEYSIVIIPLIKAHGTLLLQRNLLYTAITRAKKKVVLIGQTSAIEQAINNDKIQKRNTLLAERITQWKQGTGISLRNMFSQSSASQTNPILNRLLSLEGGSS